MSRVQKGWVQRGAVTVLALTLGLVALRWLPVDAGRSGSVIEVVLVAREMAFYRDGDFDTPNPPLLFEAGSRVRLVLRNEDPGMKHNFAVPSWDLATRELHGQGVAHVEFVVPDAKGLQAYECTPHARMMRGTIEIR